MTKKKLQTQPHKGRKEEFLGARLVAGGKGGKADAGGIRGEGKGGAINGGVDEHDGGGARGVAVAVGFHHERGVVDGEDVPRGGAGVVRVAEHAGADRTRVEQAVGGELGERVHGDADVWV